MAEESALVGERCATSESEVTSSSVFHNNVRSVGQVDHAQQQQQNRCRRNRRPSKARKLRCCCCRHELSSAPRRHNRDWDTVGLREQPAAGLRRRRLRSTSRRGVPLEECVHYYAASPRTYAEREGRPTLHKPPMEKLPSRRQSYHSTSPDTFAEREGRSTLHRPLERVQLKPISSGRTRTSTGANNIYEEDRSSVLEMWRSDLSSDERRFEFVSWNRKVSRPIRTGRIESSRSRRGNDKKNVPLYRGALSREQASRCLIEDGLDLILYHRLPDKGLSVDLDDNNSLDDLEASLVLHVCCRLQNCQCNCTHMAVRRTPNADGRKFYVDTDGGPSNTVDTLAELVEQLQSRKDLFWSWNAENSCSCL